MKHVIKILGQPFLHQFLTHEWGGKVFHFPWSKSLEAYTYEPKSQQDIDLIYGTPRNFCPWVFVPVFIEEPIDKAGANVKAKLAELEADLAQAKADEGRASELVAAMHAAAVGKTTGPEVGVVEDVAAIRTELLALRAQIGTPPEGSHPDEAKPRGDTWHHERANWTGEMTAVRAYVQDLEKQLSRFQKAEKKQADKAAAKKADAPAEQTKAPVNAVVEV